MILIVRPDETAELGSYSMGYTSAAAQTFLGRVTGWIAERGEVLALVRYSHAAGAKDLEFFQSPDAFRARLKCLSPRDCVTVFGWPQLPLRGRVEEGIIQQAMTLIPDGTGFLVVGLELVRYGRASWYPNAAGETHAELREAMEDRHDELVTVGPYPPWLDDGEDVTSAVIPNTDGSVTTGVY